MDIVIYGCTMFSSEMKSIIESEIGGGKVIAFTLDREYIQDVTYDGLPIYPFEELEKFIDKSSTEILLTLGYSGMNSVREQKYKICIKNGFKVCTFVSTRALVYSDKIAEGCIIMPGSYIGPYCNLGKCNIIKYGVSLSHHIELGNFNWIAGGTIFGGGVKVGNNCFIGLSNTIKNEVTIADRTFVGAKSYISRNTDCDCAYMGIPAKKYQRDPL